MLDHLQALLRTFSRWLFSFTWAYLGPVVNKQLQQLKKKLFDDLPQNASILEVGAGYGSNFAFVPRTTKRLVALEPNLFLIDGLKASAAKGGFENIEVITEELEVSLLPSNAFDVVICTLVLCSANDPAQAIKVIHKTLKPGGKLYIIEHVGSQNRARRFLQHALTASIWPIACDNCHLDRNTLATIKAAAKWTSVDTKIHGEEQAWHQLVNPYLVGFATK